MRYDDPNVQKSAVVGIISAIVLFVVIVGLQALFYSMQHDELEAKVYRQSSEELRAVRAQQLEQLNSYGYVDPAAGAVHIPIERAMQLIAAEAAE